jgi:hypothetical protein
MPPCRNCGTQHIPSRLLMLRRSIIVVVPGAALAVVAIAMVGPGARRPFDGVRLWGGPTENVSRFSFRVEVLERYQGIDAAHDIGEVYVQAIAENGQGGVFRGRTHPDGTVDVQIPLAANARGKVRTVVRPVDGRPLLQGVFARDAAGWGASRTSGPLLAGRSEGDLSINVAAGRGVFAAPFRDDLIVQVERQGRPVPGADVVVEAQGGTLEHATDSNKASSVSIVTGSHGTAVVGVTPASHDVDVAITARALGSSGSWWGGLPVTPGAMWLDPEPVGNGKLRAVSPVRRETAYATIASRTERLWGGSIALSADPTGFFSGEIDNPLGDDAPRPAWITLASDAAATGSGTTGWPLRTGPARSPADALEERHFADLLLLDGMPQAERLDFLRRRRARELGFAALLAAALIEVLLLADAARSAERDLQKVEAAFAESDDAGGTKKGRRLGTGRALLWLVVAAAVVVLAFSGIGVVLLWKTGGQPASLEDTFSREQDV